MRRSNPNPYPESNEPDCRSQLLLSVFSFFKSTEQPYEPIPEVEIPVNNRKKSVRFGEEQKVVLVPSRVEYFTCKLNKHIWNSQEELQQYKRSAQQDLSKGLIKINNNQFTFHYDDENDDNAIARIEQGLSP